MNKDSLRSYWLAELGKSKTMSKMYLCVEWLIAIERMI